MRHLRGEIMKTQRGQKADHAVRNPLACLGQALIGIERRVGVLVEASVETLEYSLPRKPGQIGAWKIVRVEIPWPDEPEFSGEVDGVLALCGEDRHGGSVPKRRYLSISTDVLNHSARRKTVTSRHTRSGRNFGLLRRQGHEPSPALAEVLGPPGVDPSRKVGKKNTKFLR
jgi:hypothetical protein